jgi:hypothetical protein
MDRNIKTSDEYKIHFPNMQVYAQEALKQNISLNQFLVDTIGLDDEVIEVLIANWDSGDIAKDLSTSGENVSLKRIHDKPKVTPDGLAFVLLGVSLILGGVLTIINPVYYSSKFQRYFDFTGIKWPFGGMLIILGVLCFWSVSRKKHGLRNRTMMCPKCVKPFGPESVKKNICPTCENDLEELTGFYERHPELKEDKIK